MMVLTTPSLGRVEFSRTTRNFRYCRCCGKRRGFSESKTQNGVWPACYSSCNHTETETGTHTCTRTPTLTAALFTLAQSQQSTRQLWGETLKTLCWKKPNQTARLHTQKISTTGKQTVGSWERLAGGQTKLSFQRVQFLKQAILEINQCNYCIVNAINTIKR